MATTAEQRGRPSSITVISWLAILYGLLTLGQKTFLALSPEAMALTRQIFDELSGSALLPVPFEAHMAHAFLSSMVVMIAGAFMLVGNNWARMLLLVWPLTALALTLAVGGLSPSFWLKSLTYGVLAFFLLRGPSALYFRGSRTGEFD
jgi:hypothetical protein